MRSQEKDRSEILGEYVIETESTVRACALRFGVSKSTVHKDLSQKLKYINTRMYDEVKKILEKHKSERHIRGGEATRRKYMEKKSRGIRKNADIADI